MVFVPGKSGNPTGVQKDKQFEASLRLVANRTEPDGIKKLTRIAEKLVECALDGEGWAIQQVADRLDGKPAQDTTLTIERRDATDWSLVELVELIRQRRAEHEPDRERDLTQSRSARGFDQLHRADVPKISNGSAS
jgi:hypothetical protein